MDLEKIIKEAIEESISSKDWNWIEGKDGIKYTISYDPKRELNPNLISITILPWQIKISTDPMSYSTPSSPYVHSISDPYIIKLPFTKSQAESIANVINSNNTFGNYNAKAYQNNTCRSIFIKVWEGEDENRSMLNNLGIRLPK